MLPGGTETIASTLYLFNICRSDACCREALRQYEDLLEDGELGRSDACCREALRLLAALQAVEANKVGVMRVAGRH